MHERLKEIEQRYEELTHELSQPEVASNPARLRDLGKRHAELQGIVTAYRAWGDAVRHSEEARAMAKEEKDPEMAEFVATRRDEHHVAASALEHPGKDGSGEAQVGDEVQRDQAVDVLRREPLRAEGRRPFPARSHKRVPRHRPMQHPVIDDHRAGRGQNGQGHHGRHDSSGLRSEQGEGGFFPDLQDATHTVDPQAIDEQNVETQIEDRHDSGARKQGQGDHAVRAPDLPSNVSRRVPPTE